MFINPSSQLRNGTQISPQTVLNLASCLIFAYMQKKLQNLRNIKHNRLKFPAQLTNNLLNIVPHLYCRSENTVLCDMPRTLNSVHLHKSLQSVA
jgi:hypothetical protein